MQAERNELKRQLRELEQRYLGQMQQQKEEHLLSQKERQEALSLKYQVEIEKLRYEAEELKKQRDI